jgi:hypothetical protein
VESVAWIEAGKLGREQEMEEDRLVLNGQTEGETSHLTYPKLTALVVKLQALARRKLARAQCYGR